MSAIKVDQFTATQPLNSVRDLPKGAAADSSNIRVDGGSIMGLATPTFIKNINAATRRVYRIPLTADPTDWVSSFWMEFTDGDTDVIRSPVVNDSFERFYWASPSTGLKYSPKAGIIAGSTPFDLGVPPPTTSPTATPVDGTGTVDAPFVDRSYTVTFISQYGEESQPAVPVDVTSITDQDILVEQIPQPVSLPNKVPITIIRIYRTITSASGLATYFKVADVAPGTTTYLDHTGTTTSDTVIGSNLQLPSTNWNVPPDGVQGLILMPNGILVGWVGNTLYFSEKYRPHAWPASYALAVEYPIVGLGLYGNTCVVLTEGHPAAVTGVSPATMSLVTNKASVPCVARHSITSAVGGVYFASDQGLMLYGPDGVSNMTQQLIGRDLWNSVYFPRRLRALELDGVYMTLRQTTNDGFMFRPQNQELGLTPITSPSNTWDIDTDFWTGRPWIVADGKIYEWLPPGGAPVVWRWRSKEFQAPTPTNMMVAQVFFDAPSPVQLRLWAYLRGAGNVVKQLMFDQPINVSGKETRLPSGFHSDLWQFELEGSAQVFQIVIASTVKELRDA